jgi:endonuclease G
MKKLLLYCGLAVILAGCAKKPIDVLEPAPPPVTYTIVEDFENTADKGSYAAADVSMPTGTWNLDDAVVGNLATDLKNGSKSVRLRAGKISMNFDVAGVNTLYISHGKFGKDANSTWQLLMSTDGGSTFTQVGPDIVEDNTTLKLDSFKVSTSAKVRFQIKKVGTTRVNIDDITFKGTGDSGIIVGTPEPDTEPADTSSTGNIPAVPRGIETGADAQPLTGDNSNSLFGNPSNATSLTPDNYLLDQSYYVESYSTSRSIPNWVSWHLDATTITGTSKRLDNFAAFTGLPAGAFAVQSTSYQNSGFDRGHNVPSGDRTSSTNANSATFLMTNMIPQAPQNNQGPWQELESYLRTKVLEGNEVYVIMGSYGQGGVGKNGSAAAIAGGKIAVPSNVWKVAVIIPKGDTDLSRVTSTTRVVAVNTLNINTVDKDWKKYRVSVRDIEKATGYNLLSNLPQSVQDAIETKVDVLN